MNIIFMCIRSNNCLAQRILIDNAQGEISGRFPSQKQRFMIYHMDTKIPVVKQN